MRKILLVLGLGVLLAGLAWAPTAYALNTRGGERAEVRREDVVDGAAYMAGRQILVEGTVRGDLFCAGQEIKITGTVEGDVICAGQNIQVSGQVGGDVRIAGQTSVVSGQIDGSVTAFSNTFTLEGSAVVDQDLTTFSADVHLAGKVGRDVLASGNTILFTAVADRNVELTSDNITVRNSSIGGKLTYFSDREATVEENAQVAGGVERQDVQRQDQPSVESYLLGPVYWFAAFGLIGILLLLAFPRFAHRSALAIRRRTLLSLGVGALVVLVTPLVAVLAIVTFIGIPLGILMLLLWLAALLSGTVFGAHGFGTWIVGSFHLQMRGQRFLALLLGLLLLMLLALIPILGGLAMLLALLFGVGSMFVHPKEEPAGTAATKPKTPKTAKPAAA